MRLDLTDNTIGGNNCRTYSRKEISALFPIADKKISDLCRENEKLLIFPDSLREAYDKIGDETLCRRCSENRHCSDSRCCYHNRYYTAD